LRLFTTRVEWDLIEGMDIWIRGGMPHKGHGVPSLFAALEFVTGQQERRMTIRPAQQLLRRWNNSEGATHSSSRMLAARTTLNQSTISRI
jgi:hypothetical protein